MIKSSCFGLAFLSLTLTALSQTANFKNEFGFRSDNDSFLGVGQDRYYTNGLFLSFRHALKQNSELTKIAKKIYEIEAGHYMFNPQTGQITSITQVDRPFAAFLYAGAKLNLILTNEQSFEISLNAGTIGPRAFGKEVQEGLHDAIGFYKISGWEYQVNNETGINAGLKYSKLLSRKGGNDFSLQNYVNIGNTFSGLGAGLLFRTGRINPFSNSVSNNSRISNSLNDTIPEKEFFFFTKPMLNFVAYDATVQGGVFTDDKGPVTFGPQRFQYSQEFGVNYAVKHWTLNFSVTFKSRDNTEQKAPHQYGSAFIYYRF
ncbi:MAG TPA: lipid A deacylase LpxR family protein [Pedobacter sp.]|jgi:hypothetical protein